MGAHTDTFTHCAALGCAQLELISALTNPSADDVSAIESPYAESMMEAISGGGVGHGCRSLEEACPKAAQSAIDLLRGLLQFNPAKRLTVDEALAHPFIAEFPTYASFIMPYMRLPVCGGVRALTPRSLQACATRWGEGPTPVAGARCAW